MAMQFYSPGKYQALKGLFVDSKMKICQLLLNH